MKKSKLFLFIVAMITNVIFFAQPQFLFVAGKQDLGGNMGYSIIQLNTNCNIIATGYTNNYGAGNGDWLIVNIDTSGALIWAKTIGGTDADGSTYIDSTHDGGYVIAGSVSAWLNSNTDILLVKFDASHNIVFTKTLGTSTYSEDVVSLSLAADSGFYVLAKATDSSETMGELIKYNSNGNQQWVKLLAVNSAEPTYKTDTYNDVKATPDGGCIVVGVTWSYRMTDAYNQCIVEKFNSAGTLEWAIVLGHTDPPYNTLGGYGVELTLDGNYIISGNTGAMANGGYLFKLSSTGDVMWAKNTTTAMFSKVATCYDGGFFVSAISSFWQPHNSRTFYKFNSAGEIDWIRTDNVDDGHPNPFDYYGDAFQVSDGFISVASSHKHTIAYGLTNLCIEKFKFDGSTCYSNLVTATVSDVTLVTADITSTLQANIQDLTVSTSSPVVTPLLQSVDNWTDCSITNVVSASLESENNIIVYPNPAPGSIKLEICPKKDGDKKYSVVITDLARRIVWKQLINVSDNEEKHTEELHIESLKPGTYIILIGYEQEQWFNKLIKL
ncbi:MAG: T9SS type A sorting domain-containing protein [Bacteroidota bacterium]